jgi:hypothetical protein
MTSIQHIYLSCHIRRGPAQPLRPTRFRVGEPNDSAENLTTTQGTDVDPLHVNFICHVDTTTSTPSALVSKCHADYLHVRRHEIEPNDNLRTHIDQLPTASTSTGTLGASTSPANTNTPTSTATPLVTSPFEPTHTGRQVPTTSTSSRIGERPVSRGKLHLDPLRGTLPPASVEKPILFFLLNLSHCTYLGVLVYYSNIVNKFISELNETQSLYEAS